MVEQLLKLIRHFQENVKEAASLFDRYKGVPPNKLARSRFEGLDHDGYLDPDRTIEYYFHGIGLCVTYRGRRIDWDFGHEGRLDGFDLWRLWVFVQDGTDKFLEFRERQTLEKAFREAETKGIIVKRFKGFRDNLYYLTPEERDPSEDF